MGKSKKVDPRQYIIELSDMYKEPFIIFFINRFSIRREEAEDYFSDSLLDVYDNIQNGKYTDSGEASIKTYLFRIGIYKILNDFRKKEKYLEYMEYYEKKAQYEFPRQNQEQREILDNIILNLKEPCNELLMLSWFEEKSGKEIAGIMNYKDEVSVKTQKYKCMELLKKSLKQRYRREDLL